eukprot:265828_1
MSTFATKTIKQWAEFKSDIYQHGIFITIFGESDTELRRFWYAALYTLTSFFCIGMFNVIAQKRGVAQKIDGPIADLGFDLFYTFTHKLYDYNPWIADQFTYTIVSVCAFWILLFMGRKDKGYERRIVIYKRWVLLVSFCFNLRCITVISTVLPRPWNDTHEWTFCKDESKHDEFTWDLAMGTIDYVIGNKNICYDFFFSGHTINVVLVAMLVNKYSHCIYFKIIIWVMAIFTMIAIIAVRAHYTIDIWGALIITCFLFRIFDMSVKYNDGILARLEKQENRVERNETVAVNSGYDLHEIDINDISTIDMCTIDEGERKDVKSVTKFKKLRQQKSLSLRSLVSPSLQSAHVSLNCMSDEDENL